MRDPDRIDPVLDKLREVWYRNPDLRLTQLLENVADRKQVELPNGYIYHTCCMYGMEEDELLRRLEEQYG